MTFEAAGEIIRFFVLLNLIPLLILGGMELNYRLSKKK